VPTHSIRPRPLIVLHPNENVTPDTTSGSAIQVLEYLPAYILIRMDRTRSRNLDGLEKGVVPVVPSSQKIYIKAVVDGIKKPQTVLRRHFPITPSYAFTDYRSQGQTINCAIVDLGKLATGTISLFNIYIALGRVPSRESIKLLRDFQDDCLLNKSMPIELDQEDDHLEILNHESLIQYKTVSGLP
jgi:hypothetical protein